MYLYLMYVFGSLTSSFDEGMQAEKEARTGLPSVAIASVSMLAWTGCEGRWKGERAIVCCACAFISHRFERLSVNGRQCIVQSPLVMRPACVGAYSKSLLHDVRNDQ